MKGTLYGVGVGPGDPELMTLKAVRMIRENEIIAVPGADVTSIVTSLNADILTPILGIFGGTDFSYLTVTLGTGENAPVLHYGNFITAVINFLITALVIFIMLKVINQITEKLSTLAGMEEEKPEPTTKKCPFCYSEIDIRATRCPHCTSVLDEQE